MLVESPISEPRKPVEYAGAIGVKYVWAITMDEHPMFIVFVVGVSAEMRATVDNEYPIASIRQFACTDGACEAGANH